MAENKALFTISAEKKSGSEIYDAVNDLFTDLENRQLLGSVEKTKHAMLAKSAKALDEGLEAAKVSVSTANLFTKTLEVLDTLPQAVAQNDAIDAWDLEALDATRAAMEAENADADMVDTDVAGPW